MKRAVIAVFLTLVLTGMPAFAEKVRLNPVRHVYHTLACKIGKKCHKCRTTEKQYAIRTYHARPCKICHKGRKHRKRHKKH